MIESIGALEQNSNDSIVNLNETVTDPMVTSQQLTTITSASETYMEHAADPSFPVVKQIGNPYLPQPIIEVLTRKYVVDQFQITGASAVSSGASAFQTYNFPDALFGKDNIQKKLATFQYFRASVEVEVSVTTPLLYLGALMITYLPFTKETGSVHTTNIYQRSCNNPHMLSLSKGTTVKLTIPWTNPRYFMDTTKYYSAEIGTLYIDLCTALGGSMPTLGSAQVRVMANFKNVEVAGYTPYIPIATAIEKTLVNKMWNHALNKVNGKNVPSTLITPKKPTPKKEKDRTLKEVVSEFEDSFIYTPEKESLTEAAQKSSANDITLGQAFSTTASSILSTAVSEVPKLAVCAMKEAVGDGLLGLSKPNNVAVPVPVYPSNLFNYVSGNTIDRSVPMGFKFGAASDINSGAPGEIEPDYTLSKVMSKPTLIYLGSFSNVNGYQETICAIPCRPEVCANVGGTPQVLQQTYLGHCCRPFRFWRGGLYFKFMFFTSTMIQAEVRISMNFTGNEISNIENVAGDIPSRVVEIKGDTVADIYVPYVFPSAWFRLNHTNTCIPGTGSGAAGEYTFGAALQVTILNPVTTIDDAADAPIEMMVWVAAAPDFQVMQYMGFTWPDSSTVQGDGTKHALSSVFSPSRLREVTTAMQNQKVYTPIKESVQSSFASDDFAPLAHARMSHMKGHILPEAYNSIRGLCHRYSEHHTSVAAASYTLVPHSDAEEMNIDYWSRIFLFWKGSLRIGISSSTTTLVRTNWSLGNNTKDATSNGAVYTFAAENPIYFTDWPYYSEGFMMPRDYTGAAYDPLGVGPYSYEQQFAVSATQGRMDMAAGEDFRFIYLAAPPYITLPLV